MSKHNETSAPEQLMDAVPPKDASAVPVLEKRIAEIRQNRLQAQEQARQQDAAFQGALQALEQVLSEILESEEQDEAE